MSVTVPIPTGGASCANKIVEFVEVANMPNLISVFHFGSKLSGAPIVTHDGESKRLPGLTGKEWTIVFDDEASVPKFKCLDQQLPTVAVTDLFPDCDWAELLNPDEDMEEEPEQQEFAHSTFRA